MAFQQPQQIVNPATGEIFQNNTPVHTRTSSFAPAMHGPREQLFFSPTAAVSRVVHGGIIARNRLARSHHFPTVGTVPPRLPQQARSPARGLRERSIDPNGAQPRTNQNIMESVNHVSRVTRVGELWGTPGEMSLRERGYGLAREGFDLGGLVFYR